LISIESSLNQSEKDETARRQKLQGGRTQESGVAEELGFLPVGVNLGRGIQESGVAGVAEWGTGESKRLRAT
jgi:hypothetical protein